MKTKLTKLFTTLAIALGLATAASAATPTVVWDRDFDTTTKTGTDGKTYTFADNGNDVENGIISITQAYGATVALPENENGYTVIIKYSNLSAISDRMPIFAGFATSYDSASDYGVAASANGGLGLSGYWFEWTNRYTFSPVPTLTEGSGYVVMAHKKANNMKTYAGATLAAATGATCGLMFSSGNATAIGLGGASKDTSSAKCGLTGWNNGLRIEAVAIFAGQFYAATDVANYKFPSECGVLKNARWGNIGDALNGGVATGADQAAAANTSYTVNFGTTDNICTTEIGSKGTVKIKTLKVVAHGTAGNMPPSITLTQGSLSATSTALDSSQTISIYKSNKTVYETKQLLLYTFAGDVAFDTSADITMSFANGTAGQGGCRFVTPANSKMKFNGTWSPAVEFVGDYTVARRSISINFNSGAGSVSGTYGVFPSSTWNNYSDATCSGGKTANVSDGSTVTVKWWSRNTYSWGGNDVDAALRGYLDDGACGDGTTGNGPHIGITGIPFEKYDVIAYLATDTSGRNFAPPAIGTFTGTSACATTAYSYDGLTSANRNTASLNFGTSRNATAQLGVNVVYLKKGFSQSDLDIKGGQNDNSTCRGGIAAIQIVEAFPSDYAATIDAETATWSTQDGLTTISGRPDGDNIDSSTLTLSNTTQDDATVNFDTLVGYNKIAVTSASGKSTTLSCTTAPVAGSYEIGGLAKLTYVPDKLITILSGGTLTLANTTAGTQSKIISGAGNLDIAGPVTLSANNTLTGTMTVKNGGTLTMGSASCLNSGNAVTIEQGGVVDLNGKADGYNNFVLNGGTLRNNSSNIGTGSRQNETITLGADSEVLGSGNFGLVKNSHYETTLALGTYTLTKKGNNSFWLVNTTVSGTGKLSVEQGTVSVEAKDSNFGDATLELNGGTFSVASSKTLTLKNLSRISGSISNVGTISGLTDISGNFDTTSTSQLSGSGALGFADTVNFHDGTIILNTSILTTLGTDKTVTIGDNGILDIRATRAIKVSSIGTNAKLAVKQQASETETIIVTDLALEDGDYLAKVEVIEATDDAVTMPIKSATVASGTLTITLDKTVFAYEVTGNMTISAIETAVLGEGKTFERAAQLTIKASNSPTITVDKSLSITKFAIEGAATLKFNSGMMITAATISATETVTIDCTSVTAGECVLFSGTIEDTSKFTATNAPSGCGAYITTTGITMRKSDTGTRTNPVKTSVTADFDKAFFGTADGNWATQDNWRTLKTVGDAKLWTPYTEIGNPKSPALNSHGTTGNYYWRVLFDGEYATEKNVTCSENVEGWNIEYAVLNGMHVTANFNKWQTGLADGMWIWVDKTSSFTVGTSSNSGTMSLYVEATNGVTFSENWGVGSPINYYFKGDGTVKYAKNLTATSAHTIKQMDLTVGATTSPERRHVAKKLLVSLGGSCSPTFSAASDIVVNLDNAGVTAVATNETVTVAMPVGTYKIEQESDGVYAYVVQYADKWDIIEPLTGTLTENTAWTGIVWKDAYDHTGADTTKAHTYKVVGGAYTATLDAAPADGSTIEVVTGTLALTNAEVIAKDTPITVDAGATLCFHVDAGETMTCSAVLSGAGRVVKTGAGTLVLAASNGYTGGTVIEGGDVKYGGTYGDSNGALGPFKNNTTDWTTNIVVANGAALDINGMKDATYVIELQGGATFKNSSATDIGDNSRQTKRISLSGNATVDATGSFGLHNGNHNTTVLDLGAYTLTKAGTGVFDLVNTTVNGTGTIAVNAGKLRVGVIGNVTATDATISVADGGTLQVDSGRTLTVKNLTNAGTISNSGTISGLMTLNGTINMTAGGTWTFADAVTIASGTTTLNAASATALNGKTVTLAGGTLTVSENATLDCSVAATAASTITVAEGKTLKISGNVTGGNNITIAGAGRVIFTTYRGTVVVPEGGKVGYTVNINDCGEFTVPEGVDPKKVELYKADGTKIETTTEGGKLKYTWEVTGSVCWWDYEFNEAGRTTTVGPVNSGSEGTAMTFDDDRPSTVKGKEFVTNIVEKGGVEVTNISLRVPSRPWRDVSSWPTKMTLMFYGKMVNKDNTYQLAFGSKNNSGNQLFFATKSVTDGTVDLCFSVNGAVPSVLCTMSVANAQSADHLYAVVLKDNGNGNSVVNTYLDGDLLQPYTHKGTLTLGGGFQIASGHGGTVSGDYGRPDDGDSATIDWLRVYNVELSSTALAKIAAMYPYYSENGKATRTVETADTKWVDTGKWLQTPLSGEAKTQDAPNAGTEVELTANSDTTLELNLAESAHYESLKLSGSGSITLTKGENKDLVVPNVPGKTTVNTDVTVGYDAIVFGNVTVADGKKLTFDLSNLDLTKVYKNTSIKLTGTAILGVGAEITTNNLTAVRGHEVTLSVENQQYMLNITVTPEPFIYTIAQDAETGTWSCWGVNLSAEPDWTAVGSGGIEKAGDGVAALAPQSGFTYNVRAGTLKFSSAPTAACAITNVMAGATFDLNGIRTNATENTFVVTLNGGTLANSDSGLGIVKTLTVLADSTVALTTGSIAIQSNEGGWDDTTIVLGTNKLTLNRTGDSESRLELVTTTVSGTGTIDVESGTLWIQENSNFGNALVKVGANGVFQLRDDQAKTATVANIEGVEGGKLVASNGSFTGFNLTGTIELAGTGGYGTITNAADAVANIGTRLNYYTFAGEGTVKAKFETDPKPGDVVAIFKVADGATTGVILLKSDGTTVIDSSYYTFSNGTVTFKKEAAKGTQYYFTLKQAIEEQTEAATIELVADVTDAETISVTKAITFEGGTNILSGASFTFSDGGALTLNTGCIGISWVDGMSITNGCCRFIECVTNSWASHGPQDYSIATLSAAVRENYTYEFVKSGFVPSSGEVLMPVADEKGNDAGAIKLKSEWVEKTTGTGDPQEQAVALNTKQTNDLMMWQNKILGLDGTKEESIPVVAPVQTDDSTRITFKLGGCNVATDSGATVKYKVLSADSPSATSWTAETSEVAHSEQASVDLPTSGVKYYKFEVITQTSK